MTDKEFVKIGNNEAFLGTDVRKAIGLLLFQERQKREERLSTVSSATDLNEAMIDNIETATGQPHWVATKKLLEYYKKRIEVRFVDLDVSAEPVLR